MTISILTAISAVALSYLVYIQLKRKNSDSVLDHKTNAYDIAAFKKYFQKQQMSSVGTVVLGNLGNINAQNGVESTDLLLKTMVERLKDYLDLESNKKYIVGRSYGAEFLVASQENSDKLHSLIKGFTRENPTINGIAIEYKHAAIPKEDAGLDTTLKSLQKYTYLPQNKTSNTEGDSDHIDAISMETRVLNALDEKNLNFYFKPIVNLNTGVIEMFQVSVKMHDGIQEIEPRVFLPIIGRLDLGREYDYLLMEYVSIFLLLTDTKVSFLFNVSPFSLTDISFQNRVETLSQNIDNPFRLILEIYERKSYNDLDNHFMSLEFIHSCGFRLAVDNFGSTVSSLECINDFSFDMVKFDRSYIKKLNNDASNMKFQSLINEAKSRDIETIAKWVDNNRQKEQLKELGIEYIQGFGVGEDITEDELLALYK